GGFDFKVMATAADVEVLREEEAKSIGSLIHVHNGTLYFLAMGEVRRYENGRVRTVFSSDEIVSLLFSLGDDLYISMSDTPLSRLDGKGGAEQVAGWEDYIDGKKAPVVRVCAEDEDGVILMAANGEILRFDG